VSLGGSEARSRLSPDHERVQNLWEVWIMATGRKLQKDEVWARWCSRWCQFVGGSWLACPVCGGIELGFEPVKMYRKDFEGANGRLVGIVEELV